MKRGVIVFHPSDLSGQERGVSHHGQEIFSTERPDTLTQTVYHASTFPLQSGGGPYIAPEPTRLQAVLSQCARAIARIKRHRTVRPLATAPQGDHVSG